MDLEQLNKALHGMNNAFAEAGYKLHEALAKEPVDMIDPMRIKKKREADFLSGIAGLKSVKRKK